MGSNEKPDIYFEKAIMYINYGEKNQKIIATCTCYKGKRILERLKDFVKCILRK